MKIQSLSHSLLIANPDMEDIIFQDSVIYLASNSTFGSFGFTLNKESYISEQEIADQLDLSQKESLKLCVTMGGPCQIDEYFMLYKHNQQVKICDNIQDMKSYINKDKMESYRIFNGISRWEPGQLEHELQQGDWSVWPVHDRQVLWSTCLNEIHSCIQRTQTFTSVQYAQYSIGQA